jgi:hypothetical protein
MAAVTVIVVERLSPRAGRAWSRSELEAVSWAAYLSAKDAKDAKRSRT